MTDKNMYLVRLFWSHLVFCFLLVLSAGCGPERVRPGHVALMPPSELVQKIREEAARMSRWSSFRATAHFSYKDQDLDAGFFLTILHAKDKAFTRVSIEGSLDQTLWADLVVLDDRLTLYLPLDRKVLTGSRSAGSGFHVGAGIRFSLHEMLLLAELTPVINTNGKLSSHRDRQGGSVLVIESEDGKSSTMVQFSPEGWISGVRSIEQGQERARVVYEKRDAASGLARKQTIVSTALGMEAVIWLSSWDPTWRYRDGDAKLILPSEIVTEEL